MSLKEWITTQPVKVEQFEIDGQKFEARGLKKSQRGVLFAEARKADGSVNGDKLEDLILTACIFDPETQAPVFTEAEAREWRKVPAHITGPAFAKAMSVCGMDKQDVGSPKDSDSIEN